MRLSLLQQGRLMPMSWLSIPVSRKLVSIRGMGMDGISPNSIVIFGGKSIIRDE